MSENYLKHYEMELINTVTGLYRQRRKNWKKRIYFSSIKKEGACSGSWKDVYGSDEKKSRLGVSGIYVGGYANTIGNLVERS